MGLDQRLGSVLPSKGKSTVSCRNEHELTSAWLLAVAQVSYVNVNTVAVDFSGLGSESANGYHPRVMG